MINIKKFYAVLLHVLCMRLCTFHHKVRTVVDEETEKRLMKVRGDNLKLNEELLTLKSSHKREVCHVFSIISLLFVFIICAIYLMYLSLHLVRAFFF